MKAAFVCLLLLLMPTRSSSAAAAASPDKTAAPSFPEASSLPAQPGLPDPLVLFDGTPVRTVKDWNEKRRPELKALFQHYMYGPVTGGPGRVRSTVVRTDSKALGGKATLKEIDLAISQPVETVIHLLLVVPNERRGSAPVFVGVNFCGNHALLEDSKILLPKVWMYPRTPGVTNNQATDAGRGTQIDVWALEQSIDRGYAVATFYSGDVDPDYVAAPGASPGAGSESARPNRGTIARWASGLSRAVDYIVTDGDLDPERIAVVGHSRNGKTALLAAAFDERIALAIPLQAGCGGTAPSRGKIGESVKQINKNFPHWFNAEFKKFDEQPDRLPFDQHSLIALCAPRPVLLANAVEDTWANPEGQFQMLVAADPVYRFLGVEGLASKEMPPTGRLIDSKLGYFIRPGKHSMTKEDWSVFLDFADHHFKKSRAAR